MRSHSGSTSAGRRRRCAKHGAVASLAFSATVCPSLHVQCACFPPYVVVSRTASPCGRAAALADAASPPASALVSACGRHPAAAPARRVPGLMLLGLAQDHLQHRAIDRVVGAVHQRRAHFRHCDWPKRSTRGLRAVRGGSGSRTGRSARQRRDVRCRFTPSERQSVAISRRSSESPSASTRRSRSSEGSSPVTTSTVTPWKAPSKLFAAGSGRWRCSGRTPPG
jgi:hypothetical protein